MEANRQGVFISDLRLNKFANKRAIRHLLEIPVSVYPVDQWEKAISYLTGYKCTFTDENQIKSHLRGVLTFT